MNLQRLLFSTVLLFSSLALKAQRNQTDIPASVKSYLDTVLAITQEKSLFREGVNWPALKDSVYQKAAHAQKIEDVIPAVQYMFRAIGDKHGAIVYKGRWYGNSNQEAENIRVELLEQLRSGVKVKGAVLENAYGYIQIPPINASNQAEINKYAQQIQDSICKLNPQSLKGWIIDLRLNTGGNMHPMMAGLGVLIGDGPIGAFVNAKGNIKTTWSLKSGNLYMNSVQVTQLSNPCPPKKLPKIAVLISQVTSSSGEATAIALKGRAHTRFIGEKTSGYVTANNTHKIDANSILLVAESYEADRNHTVYKDFVKPDLEMVAGDNFQDLSKDLKVQTALKWLKSTK